MVNYFIGRSEEWLRSELLKAQDDLAAGRVVTSAGSGDTQVSERVEYDTKTRIEELLSALNAINPAAFPATSIRRVSRTRIQVYTPENYGDSN